CCFRYLSRDNSDLHPSLKELAFQRLIFMTMLAWEDPYGEDDDTESSLDNYSILTCWRRCLCPNCPCCGRCS
ncbi:Os01g0869000, partial [Oryza sativa Japonica Group]